MAERNWTPAQAAAIADEGGALLVSAAAGSGKTAVLVERAVRLITRAENPIPADRLLIATFTNAAAEELRSRIGARLEAALAENPSNALRKQRMLLRRAFIGTVDAFCQQLVREYFSELGVPPDVSVADAALLESLAANALADAMEAMYETSPAFARFAGLYGRARSDAAAEKAVRELFEFTRTLPHPKRVLERFAAMYVTGEPLAETLWGRELLAHAGRALQSAGRLCAAALETAREDEALAGYLPALAEDEAIIGHLQAAVEAGGWDTARGLLEGYKFPALRGVRGYEGYKKTKVQALRDSVKGIFKDLKTGCFVCGEAEFEADRAAAAPLVEALCEAAGRYDDAFTAAKLAEKVLDFSDFEQLALTLLQHEDGSRTAVSEAVSARYDVVMVDEYQDTNELQSALYDCLAAADGSDLFFVGDVKQSIYRFRKANPGIFLEKKHSFFPHESGRHPAVLTLGHNFRSGRGVIDGVNFVFEALMSPALGDIAYEGSERLIQGGTGGDAAGLGLHIVETQEGSDAEFVAAKIHEMVQSGYQIREGGGTRPVEYGDFCILLRARANMLKYEAALSALGIPTVADMAGELLQTPEVLPLSAALAAIDNPADDVSLAATLLGPLFGFTAGQLAEMRCADTRGSLWGCLGSGGARARAAKEEILFYRTLAAEVSVGRLCEELVTRTGYLSAVGAMAGGPARRDNLLRFIAWAGEVSAGGRGGLAGFVRLLQNGKGPAENAARGLPGHVTVLTIHKSKGLEYPVCILADAAHTFNRSDRAARVQLHAELGMGLLLREGDTLFHTLPSLAIRNRAGAEAMSEEMRILYVALTRAKDKLLVTFPHKDAPRFLATRAAQLTESGPDPYLLSRAQSFADWLTAAALCHPDSGPLLEHTGGVIPPTLPAEGHWEMGLAPAPGAAAEADTAFVPTAQPDEALTRRLVAGFAQKPPRTALAALPRKASVSALSKGHAGETLLKRPSFMYKTGLSAAERGSAQHAFMQYADFAAAGRDFAAELARLVAAGHLSPDIAAAVDAAGVQRFLQSGLYGRLQAAREVLREYDFITSVPAVALEPALPPELAAEPVLVQGIADLVLVGENGAEIVDYKTDRVKAGGMLAARYQKQLHMYAGAVAKRLALPVTRLTVWSFALSAEVDVELPPMGG